MAVVVIQDVPATVEQYEQVDERIDWKNNPIEGLILHAGSQDDGTMKVVDVWESAEAFQKFVEERLIPAISEVNPGAPQAPPPEVLEVHDLLKP
jgi:heme-degrading monooxygenase HmoA